MAVSECFFTPFYYPNGTGKQQIFNGIEDYFSLSGRKLSVLPNGEKVPVKQTQSVLLIAIKVASYVTLIIPLIMLIIREILRASLLPLAKITPQQQTEEASLTLSDFQSPERPHTVEAQTPPTLCLQSPALSSGETPPYPGESGTELSFNLSLSPIPQARESTELPPLETYPSPLPISPDIAEDDSSPVIVRLRDPSARLATPNGRFFIRLAIEKRDVERINQLFRLAIWRKQQKGVALLLHHSVDIESCDREGQTPLFNALRANNLVAVRHLLEHNAQCEAINRQGRTPLLLATQLGSIEGARLLLQHRANIEAQDRFQMTPLLLAVLKKNRPIAQLLLEQKANPHAVDHLNQTAFSIAKRVKSSPIMRLFQPSPSPRRCSHQKLRRSQQQCLSSKPRALRF